MKEKFNLGICSLTSTDDLKQNCNQILAALNKIKADPRGQVDLIVLPENSLYFRIGKLNQAEIPALDSPYLKTLVAWSQKTRISILLTTPLKEGDLVSNATVWILPQAEPQIVYRKIHLFDVDVKGYGAVRESETFFSGQYPKVIEIEGWKIGLSICYDLRFAELYSFYCKQGVDLILVPAAFLVPTGKAHWHVLLRARAIESQCYVAAPAQSGVHHGVKGGTRNTFGHGLCVDPWGEVIGEATETMPNLILELERSRIQWVRQQIPQGQHRRMESLRGNQ